MKLLIYVFINRLVFIRKVHESNTIVSLIVENFGKQLGLSYFKGYITLEETRQLNAP